VSEPGGAGWIDLPVRIRRDAIYFGNHKLPGVVEEDGVAVLPGGGKGINRLTVTFLVGEVHVDDPEGDR